MPYIEKEEVKERRKLLKKEFPNFKFSIVREHYSTIVVSILESPFAIEKDCEQVNHFYIKEHYKDNPELCETLLKIKNIINNGNYTVVNDGDYGAVPSFYISISFGKWDKPYKQVKK